MRVLEATTPGQRAAILALRANVLAVDHGVAVPAGPDPFDQHPETVHVLALDGETDDREPPPEHVLGAGRLLAPADGGRARIDLVGVAPWARGHGVGEAVVAELERIALERHGLDGQVGVALRAPTASIPFSEAIGYVVVGDRYRDRGIWYRDAVKTVRPDGEFRRALDP